MGMVVNPYAFAAPTLDGSVRLLLGFEGADASTTFTDESSFARTVTATGTGQIDTAKAKFGSSSLLCDNTHNCGVTTADGADLEIGSNQFRIDAWVWFVAEPNGTTNRENGCIIQKNFLTSWGLHWSGGNGLRFYYNTGSLASITGGTPSTGAWLLLTVCRDGSNVLRMFINGVFQVKATVAGTFANVADGVRIGSHSAVQYPLNGWVDEARIIIGANAEIISSDSNFTPPVAAWPRS